MPPQKEQKLIELYDDNGAPVELYDDDGNPVSVAAAGVAAPAAPLAQEPEQDPNREPSIMEQMSTPRENPWSAPVDYMQAGLKLLGRNIYHAGGLMQDMPLSPGAVVGLPSPTPRSMSESLGASPEMSDLSEENMPEWLEAEGIDEKAATIAFELAEFVIPSLKMGKAGTIKQALASVPPGMRSKVTTVLKEIAERAGLEFGIGTTVGQLQTGDKEAALSAGVVDAALSTAFSSLGALRSAVSRTDLIERASQVAKIAQQEGIPLSVAQASSKSIVHMFDWLARRGLGSAGKYQDINLAQNEALQSSFRDLGQQIFSEDVPPREAGRLLAETVDLMKQVKQAAYKEMQDTVTEAADLAGVTIQFSDDISPAAQRLLTEYGPLLEQIAAPNAEDVPTAVRILRDLARETDEVADDIGVDDLPQNISSTDLRAFMEGKSLSFGEDAAIGAGVTEVARELSIHDAIALKKLLRAAAAATESGGQKSIGGGELSVMNSVVDDAIQKALKDAGLTDEAEYYNDTMGMYAEWMKTFNSTIVQSAKNAQSADTFATIVNEFSKRDVMYEHWDHVKDILKVRGGVDQDKFRRSVFDKLLQDDSFFEDGVMSVGKPMTKWRNIPTDAKIAIFGEETAAKVDELFHFARVTQMDEHMKMSQKGAVGVTGAAQGAGALFGGVRSIGGFLDTLIKTTFLGSGAGFAGSAAVTGDITTAAVGSLTNLGMAGAYLYAPSVMAKFLAKPANLDDLVEYTRALPGSPQKEKLGKKIMKWLEPAISGAAAYGTSKAVDKADDIPQNNVQPNTRDSMQRTREMSGLPTPSYDQFIPPPPGME